MEQTEALDQNAPENSASNEKKASEEEKNESNSTKSEEHNESWENFTRLAKSVLTLSKEQVEDVKKKVPLPKEDRGNS